MPRCRDQGWRAQLRANYQVHSKPFLAHFTQLTVSFVFDLGLNKPVPMHRQAMPCLKLGSTKPRALPRMVEERRAVLACFLFTSMYNGIFSMLGHPIWMSVCGYWMRKRSVSMMSLGPSSTTTAGYGGSGFHISLSSKPRVSITGVKASWETSLGPGTGSSTIPHVF